MASMMSRPLSALWNTTRNRPAFGAAPLRVCQCTRNPPASLVNVFVDELPRPDHVPTGFQTTISCGRGGCGEPQAAARMAATQAARTRKSNFQIAADRRMIRPDVTAEAPHDENTRPRRRPRLGGRFDGRAGAGRRRRRYLREGHRPDSPAIV